MLTAWTKGLKGDEKANREELVRSHKIVLDILSGILYNIDKELEDTVLVDYDTPSWSHKQAHLNGQRDMIRKLTKLCTVTDRGDLPST